MSKKPIDLKIKTKYLIKPDEITLHENLMKVPFYLTIIGGKGSGKTLNIVNIVHKYKKIFKKGNIIIFTNSYNEMLYELENSRDALIFEDHYDENGDNILERIMIHKKQEKMSNGKKKTPHLLLIFDDYISNKDLNKRRGIFTKLWSMARHFNISLCLSSQDLKLAPAPLRKMSDYVIIYKIFNTKERNDMIEEFNNFLTTEEFEDVYDYAVKNKYDFLFSMIGERKMLKNFEELIASEKDGILISTPTEETI